MSRALSPRDQRRTMQPCIAAQLIQDEPCNVFSRYRSPMEVGEIRERADRAAAVLVVQNGRTNKNPIEAAVSDDRLLPVLVGVYLLQEKRKDHVVEEKAAVPGAVTGADARDANQAGDVLGL